MMAKKKSELTSPFVPVDKQPYQVPVNWCWVTVDAINHYSGGAVNPMTMPDDTFELYSVPSSANDYPEIVTGAEIGSTKQAVMEGDVLLYKINPRINRVWLVSKYTENELLASSEWIVVRNEQLDSRYLMYCFKTQFFREYMLSNVSGVGGSLMRAQPKYVKNYPIPVPPLSEQQRIVARIESLFAKLDEAKEKAQEALESFETRKAAMLCLAFSGELTEMWRKTHGISNLWQSVQMKEICRDIKVGIVIKPSQYYTDATSGTPAFRSANVREFHVDNFDWVYINEKGQTANTRSIVHTGDVLIVRSGNPGTSCVVTDEFDGYNAIDILIAVPNRKYINPEFLCAFTNSPIAKQQISEGKRGMALAHFNVGGYSKLLISIPSLNEQTEIVRLLDAFFDRESQAKAQVETTLEAIDTMKKSILAKAFRGELGTNNLEDECAEKLLKRILI